MGHVPDVGVGCSAGPRDWLCAPSGLLCSVLRCSGGTEDAGTAGQGAWPGPRAQAASAGVPSVLVLQVLVALKVFFFLCFVCPPAPPRPRSQPSHPRPAWARALPPA